MSSDVAESKEHTHDSQDITTGVQMKQKTFHSGWTALTIALLILGSTLSAQVSWKYWKAFRSEKLNRSNDEFNWYTLRPSDNIDWTPCFDGFKCARLIVPLDYSTPNGPQIQIALQIFPATDTANYKGAILINPGGPGESGTKFANKNARNLAKVVGPGFDILGFDPRGIGATTPRVSCFESESQEKIWSLLEGPPLNLSDNSVPLARSREQAMGELCRMKLGGNGQEDVAGTVDQWGMGRFVGTASVATDMLRIIEKLGQEKLHYWGFSYGTVLGQYFAAMYPDKIGRVVIDGVYDAVDYRAMKWATNLKFTEDVVASFYRFCHEAGPEKCPLYAPSVSQVQQRFEAILKSLDDNPIPIPFSSKGPIVMTRGFVEKIIFQATYSPTLQFNGVAEILLATEQRNASALALIPEVFGFECKCDAPPPWPLSTSTTITTAIGCGDGILPPEESRNFTEHFSELVKKSPLAAPIWASLYLKCDGWDISAKWKYTGSFSTSDPSHPILIVSPAFDNVCPLTDALAVRERYAGAGLLVQNSYGHCSLSGPSLCTAKHLKAYFQEGKLPEENVICEVDVLPLLGEVVEVVDPEDRELLDALKELTDAW